MTGRKRWIALVLAILLLVLCVVPAFAETVSVDGSGGGIRSWFSDLAGFFKKLVVPEPNYFHNKLAGLSKYVNDRLGGVGDLYEMMTDFVKRLGSVPNTSLSFKMPDNFWFRGYRGFTMDVLAGAKPYLNMLRTVLTASACLLTAILCYHKLRVLFSSNG